MKMASPKTEREKAVIDKISNLPAFEPLNASDFYGSCEAENLYVKVQANSSREAAIKMGLMFIELTALRNIFPGPVIGPVSSKNVVITNSKLELEELYDVKMNNGEVFVELIQVLKRNEEENDLIDTTDDASTSSTAKTSRSSPVVTSHQFEEGFILETALKKYFGHETF